MREVRAVRLSDTERSLIQVAAERRGVPESTFVRQAAVSRASTLLGSLSDRERSGKTRRGEESGKQRDARE